MSKLATADKLRDYFNGTDNNIKGFKTELQNFRDENEKFT